MYDVNVRGTENVLDAAVDARARRIVHVSTGNVFGDTRGRVVDEEAEGERFEFTSFYDETKYLAHRAARARIAAGAPIVIAQPGVVYGPGDTSQLGEQIRLAASGRLRFTSFPALAFSAVHVDDLVAGLVLVHDRGRLGQSYVLGGETTTLLDVLTRVAALAGRAPPRVVPARALRLLAPIAPLAGRALGVPPNLREVLLAADGVTHLVSHEKAARELGYRPRCLDGGLRDVVGEWGPPASVS
jgi:nucleoside-diphosphate-sugar epimerase